MLIPQGRLDEASEIPTAANGLLTDEHDLDAVQRQARAKAMIELASGDLVAAERSARHAVETALQADDAEQASNWLVLADALDRSGRETDARDAAQRALAVAERKGHVLFATRARFDPKRSGGNSASP